ncbi:MAG: Ca2+-dependent phosphoinositide-specific phospholipase C, partial [Sinobacterium sp.]
LLSEVRGRIMFVLTATGSVRDDYIAGHPSLEGRAMFTTSEPGTPEAAALLKNDPEATAGEIRRLVEAGYIVRTRADADLIEARADDTTRREAAFDSGAQLINTDFFAPNTNSDFNGYQVVISGGTTARCNPVSAPVSCDSDLL